LAEPGDFFARPARFKQKKQRRYRSSVHFRQAANPCRRDHAVFERLMTRDAADIDYDDSHAPPRGPETYPSDASSIIFPGATVELPLLPANRSRDRKQELEGAPNR